MPESIIKIIIIHGGCIILDMPVSIIIIIHGGCIILDMPESIIIIIHGGCIILDMPESREITEQADQRAKRP